MRTRLTLAITCLALLLGSSAGLYAQDTASTTAESVGDGADNGADNQAAAPAEQAQQTPATNGGATGAGQAASRDPFDYESSEQISEDLSVSFPVDI